MDHWKVCAEVVGVISSGLFLYSSSLTDDKKLSFFYTLGCFVLASHLFMLGAFAGGMTTLLSALRNVITYKFRHNIVKNTFMFIFLAILVYYSFNHVYSYEILIPLASVIMSIGFIYLKNNGLSTCIFLSCVCWLFYGIAIESYSVMFLEVSTILSVLIRFLKQNNIITMPSLKLRKTKI